jgi:hypothetical protein
MAQTVVGPDGRINLCVVRSNSRGNLNADIRFAGATRYSSPDVPASATNMCVTYRPAVGEDRPSAVYQLKLNRQRAAKGTLFYDS